MKNHQSNKDTNPKYQSRRDAITVVFLSGIASLENGHASAVEKLHHFLFMAF
jgi:hypothetical protein